MRAVGGVAAEANAVIATASLRLVSVLADEANAHVISETWAEAFEPAALSNLSCKSDPRHGATCPNDLCEPVDLVSSFMWSQP